MKLVTLECAGLLPSSTAEDTITHITETWERGKTVVNMLRAHLGPDLRDVHCPLINGGVNLQKIFGLMHDTCNTANRVANRVAELMASLRDDCGRQYFGEEAWDFEGTRRRQCLTSCVAITHATSSWQGNLLPPPHPLLPPHCWSYAIGTALLSTLSYPTLNRTNNGSI